MNSEEQKFFKQTAEKIMKAKAVDTRKWKDEQINQGYRQYVLDNQKELLKTLEPQKNYSSQTNSNPLERKENKG